MVKDEEQKDTEVTRAGRETTADAQNGAAVAPSSGVVAERASGAKDAAEAPASGGAAAGHGAEEGGKRQERQGGSDAGNALGAAPPQKKNQKAAKARPAPQVGPGTGTAPDTADGKEATLRASVETPDPPAAPSSPPPAETPAPAKENGSEGEGAVPEKHHPAEAWESRPDGEATLYTFKDAGLEESAAALAARQLLSDLPEEAVADLKAERRIDTGAVE